MRDTFSNTQDMAVFLENNHKPNKSRLIARLRCVRSQLMLPNCGRYARFNFGCFYVQHIVRFNKLVQASSLVSLLINELTDICNRENLGLLLSW